MGTETEQAGTNKDVKHKQGVNNDLTESLLTESLNHHKIRNIQEKIVKLNNNNQLVTAILDKFCVISPCPSLICNNTSCDPCPKISKTSCEECHKNDTVHHFPLHRSHDVTTPSHPGNPIGCVTNTEIIVIIVLTSFVNMFFFTFICLCCKAVTRLREEESEAMDKQLLWSQNQFDTKERKPSWS